MKKEKFHHINEKERWQIAALRQAGKGISQIARQLGRSKSSISDELNKRAVRGKYDPQKAQHKAYVKRKYSKRPGMKIAGDMLLRNFVEEKLEEDWSPEEISGNLKYEHPEITYASEKAIYRFARSPYGRNLECHLRNYKPNHKRKNSRKASGLLNRIFIDQRPPIIENRARFGDWEGDLIVSGKDGKGVLLVLHERKSRLPIIEKIMSRDTNTINRIIYQRTGIFVAFNSLTLDNDISFAKHEELSAMLGAPVYFCHPYHSWEKGGVENTNRLIRQYFPKGCDISKYSVEYVREVERKLQNRPRKCLKFKTPLQVLRENSQLKKLAVLDFSKVNCSMEIVK